jgi:hypothetical protein
MQLLLMVVLVLVSSSSSSSSSVVKVVSVLIHVVDATLMGDHGLWGAIHQWGTFTCQIRLLRS